jgi:methyl-accepting chemotaxis protein
MLYSLYLSSIYTNIAQNSSKLQKIYKHYTTVKYTFLYTGDLSLQKDIKKLCQECQKVQHAHLNQEYIYKPQDVEIFDTQLFALIQTIQEYKAKLDEIFNLKKRLGVNHNQGLYGTLRQSIHKVEKQFLLHQNTLELSYNMLKLRRHEKDFMLRGLKKYIDKFDDDYNRLVQLIENTSMKHKATLKYNLRNYYKAFHNFCDIHRKLYKKSGVVDTTSKIEDRFHASYDAFTHEVHQTQYSNTLMMQYTLFISIFLLISLIFTIFIMPNASNKT